MVFAVKLSPEEKVRRAICDLQKPQPFFAHLSMHMRARVMPKEFPMQTMAVNRTGRMMYAEQFVNDLAPEEMMGVLAHEVLHCLTPDAVVSGDDVDIGSIVKGQNVVCADGESHEAQRVSSRKYVGDVLCVKARGCLPFSITPNHRVLRMRDGGWKGVQDVESRTTVRVTSSKEWVEAGELQKGDWLVMPKAVRAVGKTILKFDKYIEGNAWSVSQKLREGVLLTPDVAFFISRFVADGWTDKNDGSCIVGFAFNKKKVADAKRIVNIAKNNFGLCARLVWHKEGNDPREEGVWRVILSSIVVKRFLRAEIGTYAHNKILPNWIVSNKNEDVLKGAINGLFGGDGWVSKKRGARATVGLCTVNKSGAIRIQRMLSGLGIFSSLFVRNKQGVPVVIFEKICSKTSRVQYILLSRDEKLFSILGKSGGKKRPTKYHIDGDGFFGVRIAQIKKKKYSGMVYNLKTSEENYLVNNVVVHNCALGHPFRCNNRRRNLFGYAEDAVVNNIVLRAGMSLPKGKHQGVPVNIGDDSSEFTLDGVKIRITDLSDKTVEMVYSDIVEQIVRAKKNPDEVDKKATGRGPDAHEWGDGEGEEPGSVEREAAQWQQNLANAASYARQMGKLPAGMERQLGEVLKPKVSWKQLLLKYLRAHLQPTDWSYHKPGRKSYPLKVFLPSIIREGTKVEVIIDTSGSIGRDEMTEFTSEIVAIARAFPNVEMWVTFCDAEVHTRYNVDGDVQAILAMVPAGGGGTDMEIAVDMVKEKNPSVPVVCILTDGYTPFNRCQGDYPFDVIWCITENGISDVSKIPYGRAVKMGR